MDILRSPFVTNSVEQHNVASPQPLNTELVTKRQLKFNYFITLTVSWPG